jgi:hypothetical protein
MVAILLSCTLFNKYFLKMFGFFLGRLRRYCSSVYLQISKGIMINPCQCSRCCGQESKRVPAEYMATVYCFISLLASVLLLFSILLPGHVLRSVKNKLNEICGEENN